MASLIINTWTHSVVWVGSCQQVTSPRPLGEDLANIAQKKPDYYLRKVAICFSTTAALFSYKLLSFSAHKNKFTY